MKTEQIIYSELAKRVGDCILFNNHNAHNSEWWCGIYEQPLLRAALDSIDAETRADMVAAIEAATDESEKAKLTEELADWDENGERAMPTDAEIYQTYHITSGGAEYLFNHTSELISYDEDLDAYLWHISHYGTAWSHVFTTVHDFEDGEYDTYVSISDASRYIIG